MASSKWLQGCEICNTGLINRVDELVAGGISVRKACKLMAEEGERKIGDMVYSEAAIRARYRLHKGLREPHLKVGHRDPPNFQEPHPKVVHREQSGQQSGLEQSQPEDVAPEPAELSAKHWTDATRASANAKTRSQVSLRRQKR